MTTFYLDLEGGNDANDGQSFANRWKTFTSGATAARIAPGDTIRVMGSKAPTSCSINGTFTNKSATLTLASALTKTVSDCDAAWTASANVTATTTTTRNQGTNAASIAIAGAFTTGLVAYKALGASTDFSGYQQITFWIRCNSALASGRLHIALCSDTVGAVQVDQFNVPEIFTANAWIPVTVNKGANLGNAIQSVALYADVDPGAVTVIIDNIEAVKADGNDSLNLQSLVGKNADDGLWWPIRSILGTTVILETCDANALSAGINTNRGYYGTSETVTLYKREPIVLAAQTQLTINDSGTSGSQITYSGGWDRTDMSSQSLDGTWIDGRLTPGSAGVSASVKSYITLSKLMQIGFASAMGVSSANETNFVFDAVQNLIPNNVLSFVINANFVFSNGCVALGGGRVGNVAGANGVGLGATGIKGVSFDLKIVSTSQFTSQNVFPASLYLCSGTLKFHNCGASPKLAFARTRLTLLEVKDGADASAALYLRGSDEVSIIDTLTIVTGQANTTGILAGGGSNAPDIDVTLVGPRIKGGSINNSAGTRCVQFGGSLGYCPMQIMLENVDLTFGGTATSMASGFDVRTICKDYDATAGDHRIFTGRGDITSETSVRHTASGIAWKFDASALTEADPLYLPLGEIWCVANETVTVKLWMRRNNTARKMKLFVGGGQIAGVSSDVSQEMTAAADTWEQVSLSFTPTEAGVVRLEVHCWAGTAGAHFSYIDDLSIEQNGTAPQFTLLESVGIALQTPFLGPSAQQLSGLGGTAAAEMFGGSVVK